MSTSRGDALTILRIGYCSGSREMTAVDRDRWVELLTPGYMIGLQDILQDVVPAMKTHNPDWMAHGVKPGLKKIHVLQSLFDQTKCCEIATLTKIMINVMLKKVASKQEKQQDHGLQLDFEKRMFVVGSYIDMTCCLVRGSPQHFIGRIFSVAWAPSYTILPIDVRSVKHRANDKNDNHDDVMKYNDGSKGIDTSHSFADVPHNDFDGDHFKFSQHQVDYLRDKELEPVSARSVYVDRLLVWLPDCARDTYNDVSCFLSRNSRSQELCDANYGTTFRVAYTNGREFFEMARQTIIFLTGELPKNELPTTMEKKCLNLPLGVAELILVYTWGPRLCPPMQGQRLNWSDQYGAASERKRAEKVEKTLQQTLNLPPNSRPTKRTRHH